MTPKPIHPKPSNGRRTRPAIVISGVSASVVLAALAAIGGTNLMPMAIRKDVDINTAKLEAHVEADQHSGASGMKGDIAALKTRTAVLTAEFEAYVSRADERHQETQKKLDRLLDRK